MDLLYRNINLSTRQICEFLINNNLKVIKTRKFIYIGIIITLGLFYGLYSNYNMSFTNYILIDYILNVLLFIFTYVLSTVTITHIYLEGLKRYIIKNIDLFLPNINKKILSTQYVKSVKLDIKDDELLKYLQLEQRGRINENIQNSRY